MKIVGLMGLKGSGKTTVADYLVDACGYYHHDFSTPLKEMLAAIGIGYRNMRDPELKEKPHHLLCNRSPRFAMQTLGTEWGRQIIGEDLWVNLWKQEIDGINNVVAADVRFTNEVKAIKDLGGYLLWISRPGFEVYDIHASEHSVSDSDADDRLINSTSIGDLGVSAFEKIEDFFS